MAAEDKNASENLIREKTKSLPTLRKELEKWEKKYKLHMSINNKKDDVKKKKVIRLIYFNFI